MTRIRYHRCVEAEELLHELSLIIGINLKVKVGAIVSREARARAYARIYGLASAIQIAHSLPPLYTVEFICERALKLDKETLTEVAIHELLHIPETQKGGLRPHGKKVNSIATKKLLKKVDSEFEEEFHKAIENCCASLA
ncbi:MAG: putative metallopeptidase [Fervidicoccaceae archaeon]